MAQIGCIGIPSFIGRHFASATSLISPPIEVIKLSNSSPYRDYLTVDVAIGNKTTSFIIDSGAASTVVSGDTARWLGLKAGDETAIMGAGGAVSGWEAQGIEINIGRIKFLSETLTVVEDLPVPAIIGIDLLTKLIIDADLKHRTITFWPPMKGDLFDGIKIQTRTNRNGNLIADVICNGITAPAVIDTGLAGTLLVSKAWGSSAGIFQSTMPQSLVWVSTTSGDTPETISRMSSLKLGDLELRNVPTMFFDEWPFATPVVIGAPILLRDRFVLNVAANQIILGKQKDAGKIEFPINLSGIWSKWTSGGYKITHISPKSPAMKCGVKAGDIIFKINGRNISDNRPLDWTDIGRTGEILVLTMSDSTTKEMLLAPYF